MSKYRPIYQKIWKDKDFLKSGKDAKLLFLYLTTNESCNNSGIYEIPLKTITNETDISLSTVRQLLTNGSIKNVFYDMENEIVFVKNSRKYCRGGNPANVEKGIITEFTLTNKTPLWNLFLEENPYFKSIFPTVDQPLTNGSLLLPLPLPNNNINNRKNSKFKETTEEIITYLNTKANRNYRFTDNNISLITARLKDYSKADCFRVIDTKVGQWLGHPEMDKNLRIKTLFAVGHFDDYLNEKPDIKKQTKINSKLEIIKNWGDSNGKTDISKGNGGLIDVGNESSG
jgi:uncharacterized phage protein (TIGR02220 family)